MYASAALAINYTYDNQGTLTSTTYPTGIYPNGFNYTLDAMERPTGLTGYVSSVIYNASNQMTNGSFNGWYSETRGYNGRSSSRRFSKPPPAR